MQRLIPVRNPSIPLTGLIVLLAVVFLSLSRGARRIARSYLASLVALAAVLLTMILARVAPTNLMATFWHYCTRASLYALAPAWLWLALDGLGVWRAPRWRAAFLATSVPALVQGLIVLSNPLHRLYWTKTCFDSRTLVTVPTLVATGGEWYRYSILVAGLVLLSIALIKQTGSERMRLAFMVVSLALVEAGDALWANDVALPIGMNPLSLLSTIAAYIIGIAYARYGLPPQATPEGIAARPSSPLNEDALLSAGLSERQRAIALAVAAGQAYKAIAAREGITERTVKYHMAQILDKLGLQTREQLIALVVQQNSLKTV